LLPKSEAEPDALVQRTWKPRRSARELAAKLAKEVAANDAQIEASLAIVAETRGTIKGLDRETIIALVEDEEYCGY
jgi:hypothetical protein